MTDVRMPSASQCEPIFRGWAGRIFDSGTTYTEVQCLTGWRPLHIRWMARIFFARLLSWLRKDCGQTSAHYRTRCRKQASRKQDMFDSVEFPLESHKSRCVTRSIERICVSTYIRHEYRVTRYLPHPEVIETERDDGREQWMAPRIHIRQIDLIC